MRLETAMSASKEGLFVHGQAISVISDNISNSNTTGYKTSRSEFKDIMAATGTPTGEMTMSGCGATMQCVKTLYSSGSLEETGRALDFAIEGNGFFLVGDATTPSLTRAGNFQMRNDGYLITPDGDLVLGTVGDDTTLQSINLLNVATAGAATTSVAIAGNLCSASPITTVPTSVSSYKELNATASCSSSMEVYDSLGASHAVSIYYYKTDSNTWQAQAYVDSGDTGGTPGTPQLLGTTTLTYDGYGQLVTGNPINGSVTFTDAAASTINIDFANMTQYALDSGVSKLDIDGQAAGSVTSYEVSKDGKIFAHLTSGKAIEVATIKLGNVVNVDGLERIGSNKFDLTAAAGELTIGSPTEGSLGSIEGGALELSTVDLATEFVNLVIYQRGYQANSSALGQVSTLLQETISLIR